MNPQTTIPFPGERLKEIGMQMAVEHAESKHEGWNEKAFELLKKFLKITREPFLTEYYREWSEDKLPLPNGVSKRVYGAIILKAAKHGLVKKVGTGTVTNYKAHSCYASKWIAI